MVDSLNEEEISKALETKVPNEKGIAKLERLLQQLEYLHTERDMALLRNLQGLRSRGSAHRKAADYDITNAGLDPTNLKQSFGSLLQGAVTILEGIEEFLGDHA